MEDAATWTLPWRSSVKQYCRDSDILFTENREGEDHLQPCESLIKILLTASNKIPSHFKLQWQSDPISWLNKAVIPGFLSFRLSLASFHSLKGWISQKAELWQGELPESAQEQKKCFSRKRKADYHLPFIQLFLIQEKIIFPKSSQ